MLVAGKRRIKKQKYQETSVLKLAIINGETQEYRAQKQILCKTYL